MLDLVDPLVCLNGSLSQYRPQYAMMLTEGLPKKRALTVRNPHFAVLPHHHDDLF